MIELPQGTHVHTDLMLGSTLSEPPAMLPANSCVGVNDNGVNSDQIW